jgi:uncharacterized protein (DUF302 family)
MIPSSSRTGAFAMSKFLFTLFLSLVLVGAAGAQEAAPSSTFDLTKTIQVFDVDEGVSFDDVVESMKLRANMLNFKLVAHLPLSEQVKAMGEESRRMEIFQFCDALIAKRMVEHDMVYAGFLPCRIAVLEGEDGAPHIVTMNMDLMMEAANLPGDLADLAKQVRDTIYSIVDAGVHGDI